MYNEELKRRFIEKRSNEVILPHPNYLECQFEKTAEMENELGKDLYDFATHEIIEYYKMLNLACVSTLSVMNSHFSHYTRWCLEQNLVKDNQNHFLELNTDNFKNCINKIMREAKMLTKNIIDQMLEELENPRDQFVILALFEGIKGAGYCEIIKLRPEDIRDGVAYLCTGRKVKISKKLENIIEECIITNIHYSTGVGRREYPLKDNGYVYKDLYNTFVLTEDRRSSNMRMQIKRILEFLGMVDYITGNDIYNSGKLHRIKLKASEYNISCKELVNSAKYVEIMKELCDGRFDRHDFYKRFEGYLE